MAGRRLRLRPVGPELRHRPGRSRPALTTSGGIRLAGRRVDRVAGAVVGAERVAAAGAGRDVDRRAVGRVEQAAVADDLDRLVLEGLVRRRVAEPRRRTGVDRACRRAAGGQREARHVAPMRPDAPAGRRWSPGSRSGEIMCSIWSGCQRFGSVITVPGPVDDERRVDRLVVRGRHSRRPGSSRRSARTRGRPPAIRLPTAAGESPSVVGHRDRVAEACP